MKKPEIVNLKRLKKGDILSEVSHYIVESIQADRVLLHHYEGSAQVALGREYLASYTTTGSDFLETVEVTREDKQDGTPGIRTIFEDIRDERCFTVTFTKQGKTKTKKQIEAEKTAQRTKSLEVLKSNLEKVPFEDAVLSALHEAQNNPIQLIEEGEERVLKGFKVQFTSRDGRYNCVDMSLVPSEKETGIRPVNINTITELIVDNVKYIVK